MTEVEPKKLPLDERHRALGARMVPFAGFWMPLQFAGIKEEHLAVRSGVGIFDVSHMGEIEFKGPDAIAAVNRLVTNDLSTLVDGQAMYTAMCNEEGGIVDDLVLYRLGPEHVFVCVNASNRDKDFAHMTKFVRGDVTVENNSDDYVQLAVQGPRAQALLQPIASIDLGDVAYYHARWGEIAGHRTLISRTGYTGEDGFELYIPTSVGASVFDAVMEAGAAHGITPCGLGARDTLRLEAKMLLYGSDMDDDTDPFEAGLGWVVKLDKPGGFIGKEALERKKAAGVRRRLRGLILQDRGVLRPHYPIFAYAGDAAIGETTSGSYSPTLDQSIGLGWIAVDRANDDVVDVEVRGKRLRAAVTKKPFYKRDS